MRSNTKYGRNELAWGEAAHAVLPFLKATARNQGATAAETPRELRDAVTVHIVQTTYPWNVLFDHPNDDAGRVVPTKDGDQWSGRLFHTREEAEAWLVASKAADKAAWAKARLLAEYAFDLTPYQPGGA
jgi:hypothetical protein